MSFKARCNGCGRNISSEDVICVKGKLYHMDHFCCHSCGAVISVDDNAFVLSDGKSVCLRCYEKVAPKCKECKKAISDRYTVCSGYRYHPECFKCARCHAVLTKEFLEDSSGRICDRDCCWGQLLMDHIVNNKNVSRGN